jgi:hypothetical protein
LRITWVGGVCQAQCERVVELTTKARRHESGADEFKKGGGLAVGFGRA